MTAAAPAVSVVVAAWQAADDLPVCVESVAASADGDWELIVVDNGGNGDAVEAIRRRWPGARVIRNDRNRGVASARNQGIREARGEAVLLLDADARLTPGALAALRGALSEDPRIAVVGPRLEYPDGSLQASPRAFPRVRALLFNRPPLARWLRDHWTVREHLLAEWDHATRRDAEYVLGACQLVRRRAFEAVGLLDERIFYGPEDADFCLRTRAAGLRVVFEPRARVVHRYRRLTVERPCSRLTWHLTRGYALLFARHGRHARRRRR